MASELSRLIDDELEKVGKQQENLGAKSTRSAFQVKVNIP